MIVGRPAPLPPILAQAIAPLSGLSLSDRARFAATMRDLTRTYAYSLRSRQEGHHVQAQAIAKAWGSLARAFEALDRFDVTAGPQDHAQAREHYREAEAALTAAQIKSPCDLTLAVPGLRGLFTPEPLEAAA